MIDLRRVIVRSQDFLLTIIVKRVMSLRSKYELFFHQALKRSDLDLVVMAFVSLFFIWSMLSSFFTSALAL